jgi:hypothetical protein
MMPIFTGSSAVSMRSISTSHSDEVDLAIGPAEQDAHVLVEGLLVEHERDLVEVAGVGGVHHRAHRHIAEVGDLALELGRDRGLAAADDRVGLDAAAAQLGDGVLRRLGLLLAGRVR